VKGTVAALARELPSSVRTWIAAVEEWRPDVVVTDSSRCRRATRGRRTPLVCVDNIHMIDRCLHDEEILAGAREDFEVARAVAPVPEHR